jgi:putative ABC transport system substrate-binding protein
MRVQSAECKVRRADRKIGEKTVKNVGRLTLCAVLLALCLPVWAQQPTKVRRIGYLAGNNPTTDFNRSEAIRLALRELGYVEGQNVAIEYRYAKGKQDRNPQLAAELVRLKVDVILVSAGVPSIRAAKDATKTIPIVMMGSSIDPVEAGFVESLARPRGNITGLSLFTTELGGKRLELLKEAVPKLARVAVLYDRGNRNSVVQLDEVQTAARALGLAIRTWEVQVSDSFDTVFAMQKERHLDGLYVFGGPLMYANRKRIVGFALKSRLPAVYNDRTAIDAGGLMYYGEDVMDIYRRAAIYVDKILKGANPADLPVEQPTKFELVINLKAAKQIGLIIPPNVLARADRVIK